VLVSGELKTVMITVVWVPVAVERVCEVVIAVVPETVDAKVACEVVDDSI
jgi:hypothetical protein